MKVVRQTDELKKPRIYGTNRVTCVHATIDKPHGTFAGCFSETHHILVEKQAILNICHNITLALKGEVLSQSKLEVLKCLDRIHDCCDEIEDAVEVLRIQTENKW